MADDRRGFLKKGLLGTALLAVGGASFLATRGGKRETPPSPLLVLDVARFSIMVAVAEVVLPFDGVDAKNVAVRVDQSLSFAPSRVQSEITSALGLLENGLAGVFTRGQMTPFTLLAVPERALALNAWRDANVTLLRSAYHALRKLALAGYYSDLEKAKETGYPGPPFEKAPLWDLEATKAISPPFVPMPPQPAAPPDSAPVAPDGAQKHP